MDPDNGGFVYVRTQFLREPQLCVCLFSLAVRKYHGDRDSRHRESPCGIGQTVTGKKVQSSSASEVQIAGDDQVTRTIPMTQVRSIDYVATSRSPPQLASGAAPATPAAPAPSGPPPADADHDNVTTTPRRPRLPAATYVVPAGAELSVRSEETIDSGRAVEGQTYTGGSDQGRARRRRQLP